MVTASHKNCYFQSAVVFLEEMQRFISKKWEMQYLILFSKFNNPTLLQVWDQKSSKRFRVKQFKWQYLGPKQKTSSRNVEADKSASFPIKILDL